VSTNLSQEGDSSRNAVTAGTITATYSISVSGQIFTVNANVNSSLPSPGVNFYYILTEYTPNTITIIP
jgi:hypothetical protein